MYFLTQHGTRLELVSGTAEQVVFLLVVVRTSNFVIEIRSRKEFHVLTHQIKRVEVEVELSRLIHTGRRLSATLSDSSTLQPYLVGGTTASAWASDRHAVHVHLNGGRAYLRFFEVNSAVSEHENRSWDSYLDIA